MNSWWPSNVSEWVGLLVQLFTVIAVVLGAVWNLMRRTITSVQTHFDTKLAQLEKNLEERFKNQGERIGENESLISKAHSSIHDLQLKSQTQEFQLLEIAKDNGRIEGTLSRLEEILSKRDRGQSEIDTQIRERLAGIEAKLDIFSDLGSIAKTYMRERK
jgi:chromosome segregation ATPase